MAEITLSDEEVRALGRVCVKVGAGALVLIGGEPFVSITKKISTALGGEEGKKEEEAPCDD